MRAVGSLQVARCRSRAECSTKAAQHSMTTRAVLLICGVSAWGALTLEPAGVGASAGRPAAVKSITAQQTAGQHGRRSSLLLRTAHADPTVDDVHAFVDGARGSTDAFATAAGVGRWIIERSDPGSARLLRYVARRLSTGERAIVRAGVLSPAPDFGFLSTFVLRRYGQTVRAE
jgi:hypothetical protein